MIAEHSATNAVEKLLASVQIKAAVLRDGGPKDIPVEEIVPGDIVIITAEMVQTVFYKKVKF
jgi:Mg2+-importing ATPase